MQNGQCPKCNSKTIYTTKEGVSFGINNLDVNGSRAHWTSYVCTTCGYFENYIDDPQKLEEVAKTWQKQPAGGR